MSPDANKDIGPIYTFLGAFALLSAIGLYGYQIHLGHNISKLDVAVLVVLICVCMALLRPEWFDNFVKTVADKLPFLSYKKDE